MYLFFLAHRLLRAKQRHQLASTASWVSAVGLTLGLMVLITVSSIMNGLDQNIKQELLNHVEQIVLLQDIQFIDNDLNKIANNSDITATAPFARGQALVSAKGQYQPVDLYGIDPKLERVANPSLFDSVIVGQLGQLESGQFNVVLGEVLARRLNVRLGDKITIVLPSLTNSIIGVEPMIKRLKVSGVFTYDQAFSQEQNRLYIHYQDAQKLLAKEHIITGYRLVPTVSEYQASILSRLADDFPNATVTHWSERYSQFFNVLQIQKNVFMIVVFLLVVMAVFYSTSSLVVMVSEKKTEIALLRSLGMPSSHVVTLFLIQGFILSLIGVVLGTLSGLLLSTYITPVSGWLEQVLGVEFINKSAFMIDQIPSQIVWQDVVGIISATMCLILTSTLYPAWCASKVDPAGLLAHD
ncbi:MAG: hypothetical protein CMF46_00490 [Legionellales bacterium]|nr:hypothetical protein [Legionellales bacterium]